jgi:hypothetical protein
MQRLSVTIGAVLALATAALGMSALPAEARPTQPAADNISIISAGIAPGSGGELQVQADDGNGLALTSLVVHIWQGSTDVLDVTDMAAMPYTSPADQTWQSSAPLTLAAGTYTMTADASDSAETDTGLAAGTLPFIYTDTEITSAVSPQAIPFGGHTTVSGTVTGIAPTGTSLTGVGGVPVYLDDDSLNTVQQITVTKPDGSYKTTIRGNGDSYVIETLTNSVAQGATENILELDYSSNYASRVSATVRPEDFTYGHVTEATLTGVSQYQVGSTWKPLADSSIYVNDGGSVATVATNANGRFSWKFLPSLPDDGTDWGVLNTAGGVKESQAYGTVHIAVPVSFSSFGASLDPFAVLHAHGCVQTSVSGAAQPGGSVTIEYAAKPSGPWTRLGKLSLGFADSPPTCPDSYFSGSLRVKLANAYYRASFGPTPDYLATASRADHLWKNVTRIVSFKVSPRSVGRGGDITVKGRLEQYTRSWRSYARRQILIVLRPKGSKTWYWIHKVTTNARGYFSKTFTDPVTADWSAAYDGDATHFASSAAIDHVTVASATAAGWQVKASAYQFATRQVRRMPASAVPKGVRAK